MSEEEKIAIERLDYFEPDDLIECAMYRDCVETIKNLIKKQEKIIDEMADNIFNIIDYGTFIGDIEDLENETKVKQYFYRKVEEDG